MIGTAETKQSSAQRATWSASKLACVSCSVSSSVSTGGASASEQVVSFDHDNDEVAERPHEGEADSNDQR